MLACVSTQYDCQANTRDILSSLMHPDVFSLPIRSRKSLSPILYSTTFLKALMPQVTITTRNSTCFHLLCLLLLFFFCFLKNILFFCLPGSVTAQGHGERHSFNSSGIVADWNGKQDKAREEKLIMGSLVGRKWITQTDRFQWSQTNYTLYSTHPRLIVQENVHLLHNNSHNGSYVK